jgi:hypothetical protein
MRTGMQRQEEDQEQEGKLAAVWAVLHLAGPQRLAGQMSVAEALSLYDAMVTTGWERRWDLVARSWGLSEEYAALAAHQEPWQVMPAAEPAQDDYFLGARHALERVAKRLGVTDLHERARARLAQ